MGKAPRTFESGFQLMDLMVVVALIGIMSAVAIPLMTSAIDRMRLGQSAREVERALQMAKQRAIGKSRVMRVHFNCPRVGEYRAVELVGTPTTPVAADTNLPNRCLLTAYPYPAADNNPVTRPNLDGPPGRLDGAVSFGAVQTIEFWPDGTAHYNNGTGTPWPLIPTTGIDLTIVRGGKTSTISVNGIGRVQLAQ
jgi:type II secretory pathway pseudopilin PulG